MRNKWILPAVAAVVVIVAGVFYYSKKSTAPAENTQNQNQNTQQQAEQINFKHEGNLSINAPGLKKDTVYINYGEPGASAFTRELDFSGNTPKSPTPRSGMRVYVEGTDQNNIVKVTTFNVLNAHEDDDIWASAPMPDWEIASPVPVSGEARGSWYFEAVFPIKLLDANGKVLAQTQGRAQSSWMTSSYVPFTARLSFAKPTTPTGTLVLQNDNPSGDPAKAKELQIPVKFSAVAQQRDVKLYYYDAAKDTDSSGNVLCSRQGLVAVNRTIPVTTTPIQDTIRLLIQGNLTAAEKAQGISTEYPLPGFSLTGANLSNGILTLEFADPQNKTSGGSCRAGVLWFQIEATAKQFPGVTQVKFKPDTLFQP